MNNPHAIRAGRAVLLTGAVLVLVACGSAPVADRPGEQIDFGVDMARRGLWSEALFRFERAARMEPDSFRALNNLAVAYEANGRFEEALETYRRALRLQPANRDLRRNYARFAEFYQSFRPEAAGEVETPAAADATPPPAGGPGSIQGTEPSPGGDAALPALPPGGTDPDENGATS
jgi:tetratricopeptide (TPR) repeat protein